MNKKKLRMATMALVSSAVLAACSGDGSSTPASQVGPDGLGQDQDRVTLNTPPQISGSPAARATVGQPYRFTPTGHDADGDALVWSIDRLPPGMTFSSASGELSWTPSAPGAAEGIVIRVTDSRGATVSLPPFSITAELPERKVVLRWEAPAQFTDGSPIPATALDGYRIYHGPSATGLTQLAEVDSRTLLLTVEDLEQGTHYFAVTAVTVSGAESHFSAVAHKTLM